MLNGAGLSGMVCFDLALETMYVGLCFLLSDCGIGY
jgi:hypothetical protein